MGDRGQALLFLLFMIVWVVDSFFLKFSIGLARRVPLYGRLAGTAVLTAAALMLMKASHRVLREMDGFHVITRGAFGRVRHPLYLGSMLLFTAFWTSTLSLAALIILIIVFIFYDHIATYEEKKLEEKFGDDYLRYKEKVSKWMPKLPA